MRIIPVQTQDKLMNSSYCNAFIKVYCIHLSSRDTSSSQTLNNSFGNSDASMPNSSSWETPAAGADNVNIEMVGYPQIRKLLENIYTQLKKYKRKRETTPNAVLCKPLVDSNRVVFVAFMRLCPLELFQVAFAGILGIHIRRVLIKHWKPKTSFT